MTYAGQPRLDFDWLFTEFSNDFDFLFNLSKRDVHLIIGLLSHLGGGWPIVDSSGAQLSKVGRLSDLDAARAYLADLERRLSEGETMQKIGPMVYDYISFTAAVTGTHDATFTPPEGELWRVREIQVTFVPPTGGNVLSWARLSIVGQGNVLFFWLPAQFDSYGQLHQQCDLVIDADHPLYFELNLSAIGGTAPTVRFYVVGWELTN